MYGYAHSTVVGTLADSQPQPQRSKNRSVGERVFFAHSSARNLRYSIRNAKSLLAVLLFLSELAALALKMVWTGTSTVRVVQRKALGGDMPLDMPWHRAPFSLCWGAWY